MRRRFRKRVGIDVDGVLADFQTPCLSAMSTLLGREIVPTEVTEWDIMKLVPETMHPALDRLLGRRGFAESLQPLPGAIRGVDLLRKVADVYIVTSPFSASETWVHEREKWLNRHFGIARKHVVHTAAKYTFSGAMLIDDRPENVEEWAREHPTGVPVLWAAHYNNEHKFHPSVHYKTVRTTDWEELAGILDAC